MQLALALAETAPPPERFITAVHESGHCLVARHFNIATTRLAVFERGTGVCTTIDPCVCISAHVAATVSLAGEAAEHMLLHRERRAGTVDRHNAVRALDLADDVVDHPLLDRAWRRAVELVRMRSAEIFMVANELHRRGELSREQIAEVLQRCRRRAA